MVSPIGYNALLASSLSVFIRSVWFGLDFAYCKALSSNFLILFIYSVSLDAGTIIYIDFLKFER